MATRLFRTVKFTYTRDDGVNVIRAQRVYGDSQTRQILTPITPLLSAREVGGSKVDAFLGEERHVLARIPNDTVALKYSEFKVFIPYKPSDSNLRNHIAEINAVANVACTYYYGENHDK